MPPEGSEAQQSFIPEPQPESPDETANLLAADRARSAADLRNEPANDNYQPYSEQPANDNNIPAEENSFAPPEEASDNQDTRAMEQTQLNAQEQAEIALSVAASKQRQSLQIQREIEKLQNELGELEKDLAVFKDSKLGGFLSIFQPRMNFLIDSLIKEMQKSAERLEDDAKVSYYSALITTISSLIAILTAFKFIVAVIDAAFVDGFSCLRLVIASFATCIIPIILVLIAPIYIPFLAVIFIMGKIPLLKGILTKNIVELIEKLKRQRTIWQTELDKVKKQTTLRKQIKGLKAAQKQINRQG